MIRKSMPSGPDPMGGDRFFSGQTQSVCPEIMLKQKDEIAMRSNRIVI
jgi:hypothetical protein